VKHKDRDHKGRFVEGNPGGGRPRGAPNRISRKVKEILSENAEELTRALVEKAKAGDVAALKVIFSRLVPPVTSEPLELPPGILQPMEKEKDFIELARKAFQLVIDGHLTPKEAAEVLNLACRVKRVLHEKEMSDGFGI